MSPLAKLGIGFLVIALVFGLLGVLLGIRKVDASEACVIKRGGEAQEVVRAGIHVVNPILDRLDCYGILSHVYETNDENGDSKADYTDFAVDGVTIDGQPVVVTYTIRFKINPDNLMFIHGNVGRDLDKVVERVVKFHSRTIVRQVINTHTAEELYLGGLDAVSSEISVILDPLFADSGVTLEYFEIKRPTFSEQYMDAIEAKQLEIERAEAEKNRLETEKQTSAVDREIATREKDIQEINAQGDALEIELQGEALRENPEVLELRRIEALNNADYMIVPDSSMPIIQMPTEEVSTPVPTPAPTEEPQD